MINYKVCDDCIMAIANNDFTGLDYYYSEEESRQRMEEIEQGMEELGPNIVCTDEEPDDFCISSCDCCKTQLAGKRHHVTDISDNLKQ